MTEALVGPQYPRSAFGRRGKDLHEGKAVLRGQENLMWNTDLIETVELENLIGQTAQCLYSGDEYQNGRVQKRRRR